MLPPTNRNNEPQQVLRKVTSVLLLALVDSTPVHEGALTKVQMRCRSVFPVMCCVYTCCNDYLTCVGMHHLLSQCLLWHQSHLKTLPSQPHIPPMTRPCPSSPVVFEALLWIGSLKWSGWKINLHLICLFPSVFTQRTPSSKPLAILESDHFADPGTM